MSEKSARLRHLCIFWAATVFVLGASSCERSGRGSRRAEDRPDVLLITLDTTRADHLHCYGYEKSITPRLDELAGKGVLFTQAIAQAAVTPVSHASILTGLNPYSHGLRVMHGVTENRLAEERVTLAEVLKRAGYQTAAFVSAFPVTERFGLHQGFDMFDADFLLAQPDRLISDSGIVNTGKSQRHAGETTTRALTWLEQAESPYFLWLHYFDPHDRQVMPPQEFMADHAVPIGMERDVLRAIYDIEIEYMDQQIGRVFDWLIQAGQAASTIVVVVADHGEGLGDHDWWTHGILYQEQVRVPLIIRAPSISDGWRVDYVVRTIDIMPTVLDLIGLDTGAWPDMEGESLVPLMGAAAKDPGYRAYCDSVNMLTYRPGVTIQEVKDDMLFGLVDWPWKYVHHALRPEESELYDLAKDPRELENVIEKHSDVATRLKKELMALDCVPSDELGGQKGAGQMSPEDLRRLRSLGYLDEGG
ncbi:MAG: sulfatase [Phycisphaerales bacterium]|nr:MAG: sulfatase [Phycisphaerales bacterium]